MSEIILTKRCNVCNQIKSLNEFHKNISTKDGYHCECKQCRSIYTKIHYRQKQQKKGFQVHNGRKHNRVSAKNAINNSIARGTFSKANINKCAYCPKQAEEYHHYKGYEPEHHFDVVPICKKCHRKIHKYISINLRSPKIPQSSASLY